MDGYIDKWLFHPGQEVHAGDVLYVLDLRPYEAAVEQAKGNLAQSEADLEFARKQVALLQAEANLAAAQANLLKAQQDYDRLTPLVKDGCRRATGAGHRRRGLARGRGQRAGQPGQRGSDAALHANADLVHGRENGRAARRSAHRGAQSGIRDHSRAHQRADRRHAGSGGRAGDRECARSRSPPSFRWIPSGCDSRSPSRNIFRSRRIPRCSNPRSPLILADNTEFPQKGRIENTLNQVDPKTGTLELQASFPNPQHTLLPGQFGKVRVETELRRNVILVPQRAIQQLQSVQTVLTVGAGNVVELRPITTAERVGEDWIVQQGLKPGDRVIVEGQLKVRPGARVTPTPYRQPLEHRSRGPLTQSWRDFSSTGRSSPSSSRSSSSSWAWWRFRISPSPLSRKWCRRWSRSRPAIWAAIRIDLEKTVAQPIEEQLAGLDGMMYFLSSSANNGSITINVTFQLGTNPDTATVQTQNKVNIALPRLPPEVQRQGVTVKKVSSAFLMVIGLVSPDDRYDSLFLTNYAQINLLNQIGSLPGVGDSRLSSQQVYSMRVWVDPDKMAKLGLTATDISNAINAQNRQNPAGALGEAPAPPGTDFQYAVTAPGRLVDPAQFGDIVLRAQPDASLLRIRDIGRVELGAFTYTRLQPHQRQAFLQCDRLSFARRERRGNRRTRSTRLCGRPSRIFRPAWTTRSPTIRRGSCAPPFRTWSSRCWPRSAW